MKIKLDSATVRALVDARAKIAENPQSFVNSIIKLDPQFFVKAYADFSGHSLALSDEKSETVKAKEPEKKKRFNWPKLTRHSARMRLLIAKNTMAGVCIHHERNGNYTYTATSMRSDSGINITRAMTVTSANHLKILSALDSEGVEDCATAIQSFLSGLPRNTAISFAQLMDAVSSV